MRLQDYLNELSMRKQVDIKVTKSTGENFVAKWTIEADGETLKYSFIGIKMLGSWNYWNVAFVETQGKYVNIKLSLSNTLEIFSGAKISLEKLIKQKDPDGFSFTGLTPKLEKLYIKFAKQIEKSSKYVLVSSDGFNFVKKELKNNNVYTGLKKDK